VPAQPSPGRPQWLPRPTQLLLRRLIHLQDSLVDLLDQDCHPVKKFSDTCQIAAASREQSAAIEQVNKAVLQMDETTQQNAALVEEATAASRGMAEQARPAHDSAATL